MQWATRAGAISEAIGHEGRGHRRYAYGTLVWCDICGAYADRFAVGLARPCPGRPLYESRAAQLRRLQRGRHPLTGIPFRDIAIAEHVASDGSTRQYPSGATTSVAQESWGSVHDARADRRTDPARARPSRVMGRSTPAATPVLERRRPASTAVQPTVADRMDALRRRLQSRWEYERAQGAVLEPGPPVTAVGSTGCVAVTPSTAEVAQLVVNAGEASHQAHHNIARAVEQGAVEPTDDDDVDDARGSKRRRLIAALSAPVRITPPIRVVCGVTSGALGNSTRTVARSNDDTRMRVYGDCGIMTDDGVIPPSGKKCRRG